MTTTAQALESRHGRPHQASFRFPATMLAGTTLLWVGALAWYVRGYFVDDAYITFRFVDNLWLGQGFLFNPPERLEGITNLGWALVLIPLRGLISVPDAAKVLGLVSLTVGLWLVGRIGRRLFEPGSSVPAAVVLATAASAEYCYFSLAGMETGLAALLGLLAIRCLQRRPEGVTAVSIVAAGLFLVRPEYLIAFPLYLASGCLGRRRARTARSLSIFIGAVAAMTAARLAYFGAVLPVTAWSKAAHLTDVAGRALDSLTQANPNLPPPFAGILALAVMALGAAAWHRREPEPARFASALVTTALAFAIYAPEDWTHLGRYFAPAIPVAMLLVAAGCREAVIRILPARAAVHSAAALGLVLILAVAGLYRTLRVLSPAELDRFPGYIMKSDSLIAPSLWIDAHVARDAVIATRRIGAVGFFTGRHIYDYKFGLTDSEVARIVERNGPLEDPRHPALLDNWRRHAPDFILEDAATVAAWVAPNGVANEVTVAGTRYREVRRFPIGDAATWSLLEAVDGDRR